MADDPHLRRVERDREIEAFVLAQSRAPDGDAATQGEVARFWAGLDTEATDPSVQAMLAAARARVDGGATVVPFRRRLSAPIITALAASLVAVIGVGSWVALRDGTAGPGAPVRILTNGAAAPHSFRLADGSVVTLDARSAVEVPAWSAERAVMLTRGRAFFKVVHDSAHPFVVTASGHRITDVGTAFSVQSNHEATVVTLVEGAVRVLPKRADAAIDLKPDEALTLPATGSYQLARVDADAQNEWREGRISFDNQRASAVLDSMNRYFSDDIVLADPVDGRMAISGTFRLDDRVDVVRALAALGVETSPAKGPEKP